eukprot:403340347
MILIRATKINDKINSTLAYLHLKMYSVNPVEIMAVIISDQYDNSRVTVNYINEDQDDQQVSPDVQQLIDHEFEQNGEDQDHFGNQLHSSPDQLYSTYEEIHGVNPNNQNQERKYQFSSGKQFGIISSYPSQVYKPKSNEQKIVTCAVCIEDLTTDCMYKELKCSHQFHTNCITDWLIVKLECPLCKETVNYKRPD